MKHYVEGYQRNNFLTFTYIYVHAITVRGKIMNTDPTIRISQVLDSVAKKILEEKDFTSYDEKLRRLEELINMILRIDSTGAKLDKTKLDSILRNGNIEIIERKYQQYALIPIVPLRPTQVGKSKKKKKVRCSYCNEMGHTRAICERRQ